MLKEARREILGIRLTKEEKELIVQFCKERGYKTISECIRKLIKKEFKLNNFIRLE